jgi:predicted solute-binding protein
MERNMVQSPFLTPLVGVPTWQHAAPLLTGLEERGDLRLTAMPVEAIAEALRLQACACALVPPCVLLDDPALCVIPGAGLAAQDGSTTERLITTSALESVRRIQVTPEARHLAIYIQIIFAERGLPMPAFVPPDVADRGDALLVSGAGEKNRPGEGHDLAELWRALTRTPLVLGVWVCHGNSPIRLLRTVLGESARRGEAELNKNVSGAGEYYYRILSAESECLRALHRLARHHAIAGASVESIAFC